MRRVLVGTTPLTQSEARTLINEEVADVLNCVEALEAISFVDRGQVARIQAEKLERWDRRTREGVT
uniref:Triphosphate pyrophosphohydrolase-like protein n=1 Tax=Myoviridae sp. ctZDd15 TaxID=2826664 RepID=A0A8S5M0F8_9CAUD|nr:MAG TPA: triphosphate pyrophosphohydrolase-like protein [Myoviridae sp. ctZDd15]